MLKALHYLNINMYSNYVGIDFINLEGYSEDVMVGLPTCPPCGGG